MKRKKFNSLKLSANPDFPLGITTTTKKFQMQKIPLTVAKLEQTKFFKTEARKELFEKFNVIKLKTNCQIN